MNRSSTIIQRSGAKERAREIVPDNDGLDARTDDESDPNGTPIVFPRRVLAPDPTLIADTILPPDVLLEFVPADFLNAFINYVDLRSVITERDPEEDERYINMSNRFYTHFHEFGTVIHVVASSRDYLWYFCYDIDASDCSIGRVFLSDVSLPQMIQWIYRKRVSGRYPTVEIDVRQLHGWRSFQ